MSFELVNHQIKHIFGGIEAEKNMSLQLLENWQKKITKSMEKAQINHKKVYQSIITIKSSLIELSENYLSLSNENKQGGLIAMLSNQINAFFQDISQQSLALSKKMEAKVENYIPNLKKIKQKYKQSAQNLEHYRKKIILLKKNVQKQSSANIKQQQNQRYQRNQEKLKKAQDEYDEILIKTTKRYLEFNNEGLKDVYNDLITIFSTIGGNVMRMGNKLTKNLCQNFGTKEILLAKQLRLQKKSIQKIEVIQEQMKIKKQSTAGWIKQQAIESRKLFFQYLTQQKQISNYLKGIIDKQLFKIESENIQDAFKQKPVSKISSQNFVRFKNIYENHQIKQNHHTLLDKMREEDPIEACQDLLEIQKPSQITHTSQKESNSSRYSPQRKKKLSKPQINYGLKQTDDFFKLDKPQQQLNKLHQHPFNFDLFSDPIKIKHNEHNLLNTNHHLMETLKPQQKTFTNYANFDNFEQLNNTKSLPLNQSKSSKNNEMDLLNL